MSLAYVTQFNFRIQAAQAQLDTLESILLSPPHVDDRSDDNYDRRIDPACWDRRDDHVMHFQSPVWGESQDVTALGTALVDWTKIAKYTLPIQFEWIVYPAEGRLIEYGCSGGALTVWRGQLRVTDTAAILHRDRTNIERYGTLYPDQLKPGA